MTYSFPDGFVWGTATAAHQVEGGTWNNDWWAFEHTPGSGTVEPAGDACDHFWRYPSDIAMLEELGFGAYRFSLEWSRIEPEAGEFSRAALDHYQRMCVATREHGMTPVVTFHHFTTPRWAVTEGGWTDPAIVDRFARFCEVAVGALGDDIGMACTINEPNIVSLMGHVVGAFPPGHRDLGEYAAANEHLKAAHRKGYDVIKAGPGDFPVGSTIAMGDWWIPDGAEAILETTRQMHEGQHLDAAAGDDFVGVQAYSRTRLDATGLPTGSEPGVEELPMGYEYWPDALEVAIRYAVEKTGSPIYVTENGIGTSDDTQRIRYVTDALGGLRRCLDDGLDVRGYFYWSCLDNFEWAHGYGPQFGLVGVDRTTQVRTPKPSASWLGAIARANAMD